MPHDIRLLVTDLDGTLLDEKSDVSAENLAALQEASRRGVAIALCSGRDAHNISEIALKAGLPECAILALNGCHVLARPHGEVLCSHKMDPAAAKACLDILLPQAPELLVCSENAFGVFNAQELVEHLRATGRGEQVVSMDDPHYLYGMARAGLNKLVYTERINLDKLQENRARIEEIPDITVTSSWFCNIEIMPLGIDKGLAVRQLARRLGIALEQVMAFGDNDNDLPMLTTVGYGVAMANAIESVRAAAPYVTETNRNHGVAAGIRRFIFAG